MHCDSVKSLMYDSLDKTISLKKAAAVEAHLAKCEKCRNEFRSLEKADTILREAVRGMISRVEVPPGLNGRIEKALAGEVMKNRWPGRVPAFLRTPAVAAALLLAVITAGALSIHNPFVTDKGQTDLVMQAPVNTTQEESRSRQEKADKVSEPAGETVLRDNGPAVNYKAPEGYGLGPAGVSQAGRETPPALPAPDDPAASTDPMLPQVPPMLEKEQLSGEKRLSADADVFLAAGSPVLKKGTLEEAASDVGFSPLRPSYLPEGSEIQDVSWQPGIVYQSYRTGQFYFEIVQGTPDIFTFNYEEELSQGGEPVEINSVQAVLSQSVPEPGDSVSGPRTCVRWAQDQWTFTVAGEIPREEIIKVASSLK